MKNENEKIEDDGKTLVENTNLTEENNETVEEEKKPLKDKVIDRKTALLVAGGSLLAGTGFAAGINNNPDEILIDTDNDNIADTILIDENEDGVYNIETESGEIEELEEIEEDTEFETYNSNSHTFNINTAPNASEGTVTDNMSFSEAFGAARAELGAGGVFEWNGNLYGTFYATEVDEHMNPTIDYVTTADEDYQPIMHDNTDGNAEEIAEISNEDVEEVQTVENAEDIDQIIGSDAVNTGDVNYDGEVASDVPDDVLDADLDTHNDDLLALGDDFDDMDDWA